MTRLITLPIVALLVLFAAAAPAEAGMWDWIHELSGPGPSGSRWGGYIGTLCFDNAVNKKPAWPCVFGDIRSFETLDEDNFPNKVSFEAYDFGATWKLYQGVVEVGAGLGFMKFSSEDRINNTGEKIATSKMTLTLPRVVFVPGAFGFDRYTHTTKANIARMFKLYGRLNIFPGTMNATDFGVRMGTGPGESTFTVDNDVVPSMGILIDFSELLY